MILIVGLGNPGKKYERTRHNVGWLVVERLTSQMANGQWSMIKKLQSLIIHQSSIIFAKPTVFMNESGMVVKKLITYYRLPITNLWVVHDDIDLPLGRVKIQMGGGSAGHKGAQSIIDCLGREDFVRFRLGIGRPEKVKSQKLKVKSEEIEKFVLEKFTKEEKPVVEEMVKRAVEVIKLGLKEGIKKAMACQF